MKIDISVPKQIVQGWSKTVHGSQPGYISFNKVGCIKAIRSLSGLGLKEAKDLIEAAMAGTVQTVEIAPKLTRPDIEHELRVLRDYGCVVNDVSCNHRTLILDTLRETAIFASSVDEYSLAARLNELLAEEKSNDR
jgi:hypothetical protein